MGVKPKRRHPWWKFPKNLSVAYKPWYKILWGLPFLICVYLCRLVIYILVLGWKFSPKEARREADL